MTDTQSEAFNNPWCTESCKQGLAENVNKRIEWVELLIDWKENQRFTPNPPLKNDTLKVILEDIPDRYVEVMVKIPCFEDRHSTEIKKITNFADKVEGFSKPADFAPDIKKDVRRQFGRLKAPARIGIKTEEPLSLQEHSDISIRIMRIDAEVITWVDSHKIKPPERYYRIFGEPIPEPERFNSHRDEFNTVRSLKFGADIDSTNTPERWLLRIPKDEVKKLLEECIAEGTEIIDSFAMHPPEYYKSYVIPYDPAKHPNYKPYPSGIPPILSPSEVRRRRAELPINPVFLRKHPPKNWFQMSQASIAPMQTEYSLWDSSTYTILERSYKSPIAYRDYIPGHPVERSRRFEGKKKEIDRGGIIMEWVEGFINAYKDRIARLRKYISELDHYRFASDELLRVGDGEKVITEKEKPGEGNSIPVGKTVKKTFPVNQDEIDKLEIAISKTKPGYLRFVLPGRISGDYECRKVYEIAKGLFKFLENAAKAQKDNKPIRETPSNISRFNKRLRKIFEIRKSNFLLTKPVKESQLKSCYKLKFSCKLY